MSLYEEYRSRQGLVYPVIKRTQSQLSVVFRANAKIWRRNWVFMTINYHPEQHQPSYYLLNWYVPNHNGFSAAEYLTRIGETSTIYWDNYETEMIQAAQRRDGLTVMPTSDEARLATWEAFLYLADEKIYALPSTVKLKICRSVDEDLPLSQRLTEINEIHSLLSSNTSFGLKGRWDQFTRYWSKDNYADWFADLFVQMKDDEYRRAFCDVQSLA